MRLLPTWPAPGTVLGAVALFVSLAGAGYSATGGTFILGKSNTAAHPSVLTANVNGPALRLSNTSGGANATALRLNVGAGKAPLVVGPGAGKATNLNADKLDGIDATGFLGATAKAADADLLDGINSSAFWLKSEAVNAASLGGIPASSYLRKTSHVQINGTGLAAGATHSWFTFGWPTNDFIEWQARPTTNGGKVSTSVQIENGGGTYTYWITVTNTGTVATNYEVRAYRFATS